MTPDHTLTHEQAVQACANVGVDLTCGACAVVFYTGVRSPHDVHTCAESDVEKRVQAARLDGARVMREAILRVERWSAGGVQAILDLDPATVVGVATTVPDETLRAHEPPPCPGCAGDLAGLVDAVCPTCRAVLTVAFAPGEVPRG